MCCFTGAVDHVGDTRIFARAGDGAAQYLVYRMRYHATAPVAMVLPLPTPKGAPDDAVRFIDLSRYPTFFDDLHRAFPQPTPVPADGSFKGAMPAPAAAPLPVIDVGSFVASFVPSRADFARLDARFRLPDAAFAAFPAYASYGFAVFQLRAESASVHPIAFSFPRRDPWLLFFPTVHVHDGTAPETAAFDHVLYCQAPADRRPMLGEGWEESATVPSVVAQCDLAAGILAPDEHLHRLTLSGALPNRDTLVRLT